MRGLSAARLELLGPLAGRPALTLHPEWIAAITHLDKRTENRSWRCPAWLVGEQLVLHAGKLPTSPRRIPHVDGWTAHAVGYAARLQAVVDTAEHAGWSVGFDGGPELRLVRGPQYSPTWRGPIDGPQGAGVPESGVVVAESSYAAVVRVIGCDEEQRTAWDVRGQCHWRLEVLEVLERPIPAVGRQGLWRCE